MHYQYTTYANCMKTPAIIDGVQGAVHLISGGGVELCLFLEKKPSLQIPELGNKTFVGTEKIACFSKFSKNLVRRDMNCLA